MSQNYFLSQLPSLQVTEATLHQRDVLFDVERTLERVYFPTTAIVSLVMTLETGSMVEGAMVGRDGVIGGLAAIDDKLSLYKAIVQLGGKAMTCPPAAFKSAVLANPAILAKLAQHEQVQFAQAQQSAACNVSHNLEARLARWMMRARDLSQSNDLLFTQDFISDMLGVRRTTVSITAHQLQNAGLIKYSRGRVTILNPEGLREVACECYEAVKLNYDRLWSGLPAAHVS